MPGNTPFLNNPAVSEIMANHDILVMVYET